MLDGLFMLLTLSAVMAIASFLTGALPLFMTMSQSKLRLISTIGMGVLVGTSLIVIIPEGIETLYSTRKPHHAHKRRDMQTNTLDVRWLQSEVRSLDPAAGLIRESAPEMQTRDLPPGNALDGRLEQGSVTESTPTPIAVKETPTTNPHSPLSSPETHPDPEKDHNHEEDHNDADEARSPHAYVGLSLILGFILMYLIDKLPEHASKSRSHQQPYHIALDNLSGGLRSSFSPSRRDEVEDGQPNPPQSPTSRSVATTTGLVIHAAADGIALGASSSTANTSLGFIIFFAIMIHKAPAAFGLTSVLLKQGLSKREARSHLIIFSLAAPIGALATWMLISLLGRGLMGGDEGTQWWTGVLLIFSAGTFLYVAMHAMQDNSTIHQEQFSNGYGNGGSSQQRNEGPRMRDTLAAVAGMLIPLLTQFGHHH